MYRPIQSAVTVAKRDGLVVAGLRAGERLVDHPYDKYVRFAHHWWKAAVRSPDSWRSRIAMLGYGWYPISAHLYSTASHPPESYLSDLQEHLTIGINGRSRVYLDDKERCYELLADRGFESLLPTLFGRIEDGVLVGAGRDFVSLLDREGSVVLKRRGGSGGRHVHIATAADGHYAIDDVGLDATGLTASLSKYNRSLVTEYIHQAPYAGTIYPNTANSIRLLTMHPRDGSSFLARAVHRFGADTTGPVDNFSQGGLSAEIAEDGQLGRAVRYHEHAVTRHDTHPDTGVNIRGVAIPGWETIVDQVLEVCEAIPELVYVGWDIIVEADGAFSIIEGNSHPSTHVIQAHGPLLTDDRVRRFFAEHGISGHEHIDETVAEWNTA